jgi:hypothetical protein
MTPRAPSLPPEYRQARPQLERNTSTQSKISLPTSSQSNEADDEQSFSDCSFDMESCSPEPQYEGEDTRLTSDKELSGFYMYGWAAEVCFFSFLRFASCFILLNMGDALTDASSATITSYLLMRPGLRSMRYWLLHTCDPRATRSREWSTSFRSHHALQGLPPDRDPSRRGLLYAPPS